MNGVLLLSWRHLVHHRGRTAIAVLCIATAAFLPLAADRLVSDYQAELPARARTTPLVAGAKGNRFALTMAALYFRPAELDTIPFAQLTALGREPGITAIPVHARFTARGVPVIGTGPEYWELRGLRAAAGSLPVRLGEVVLGAGAAAALELGPGDHLFSDPTDLYDLAVPPALRMSVCGVLAPTGTPDDDAVFVDVKTCWILEGLAHGHDTPQSIDPAKLAGAVDNRFDLGPAVIVYQEVTDQNVDSFHYHGDAAALPLTAIIVVPADDKARTLAKAKVNASAAWQMVTPTAVIDALMRVVFRIKALFDGFAVVLGASTAAMLTLQLLLSVKLRRGEMVTLNRIGCSPGTVAALYAVELLLMVAVAAGLAASAVIAVQAVLPDLTRVL